MNSIKFAYLGHNDHRGFKGESQVARILERNGKFLAEVKTCIRIVHRKGFPTLTSAKLWVCAKDAKDSFAQDRLNKVAPISKGR